MAVSLERELKGVSANSLGIAIQDISKNKWSLSRSILDCIVKRLKDSGFSAISVTKTQLKGSGTVYIFEFSLRYEKSGRQSFMFRFEDVPKIEVDLGEVETSLREGERNQNVEDIVNARLDIYANAVTSCSKSGVSMSEQPAVPNTDVEDLAEGMKKMAVGGRKTRRQKKRRATRRR